MKKILLIDGQKVRAKQLAGRLEPAGFEVLLADSSLYALTMLEWQRPDLVVIHGDVDDMPSHELCAIIKQDAVLSYVPMVLLGAPKPAVRIHATPGFDLVVPETEIEMLALRLLALLEIGPRAEPEPVTKTAAGSSNLEALITDSALGLKTGLLMISSEDVGPRFLVFDNGEIIHAVYGDLSGSRALARILYEIKRAAAAAARFEPISRSRIAIWPRSIAPAQRQQLLELPQDQDESSTAEIYLPDFQERL